MKPFIITEAEKERILQKHIEATGRQYLPETKHENHEIYTFKDKYGSPSTGYSDIDMKDFDEFDSDLGFDAPSIADIAILKKLDKEASKNFGKRRPKFSGHEKELDEDIHDSYPIPKIIRDLKASTEITDEHIEDIMNGDEQALEDAKTMYGMTEDGKLRQGIIQKLEVLYPTFGRE